MSCPNSKIQIYKIENRCRDRALLCPEKENKKNRVAVSQKKINLFAILHRNDGRPIRSPPSDTPFQTHQKDLFASADYMMVLQVKFLAKRINSHYEILVHVLIASRRFPNVCLHHP